MIKTMVGVLIAFVVGEAFSTWLFNYAPGFGIAVAVVWAIWHLAAIYRKQEGRFEKIDDRFIKIDTDMSDLKTGLNTTNQGLSRLEGRVGQIEGRVGRIEGQLNTVITLLKGERLTNVDDISADS